MKGDYDVVYPYRYGNHGERKVNLGFTIVTQEDMDDFENCDFVSNFLNNDFDLNVLMIVIFITKVNRDKVGKSMVYSIFKRQVYIDGYLENEGFIAYAPEMDIHHGKILGYKIGRVDEHAYHLEHQRTQNSWFHNPI